MILKRIKAENILKYRKLELNDLPAQGQIAVAGPNEAGKTAVGETICLGLFGRTFSLGPDQLDRVIRWGEYRGSVVLEFAGRDGGDYIVEREIDNTGHHNARLYISGEEQPVAEGIEPVTDAIHELGGFTYQSFVDSFYLAQREMEVPHAKSATVKALIGVDKLETAAAEVRNEMGGTAQAIRTLENEIKSNRQRVAEVDLDRAQLGRLESQRDAKIKAAAAAEAESDDLTTRAESIGKAATAFVDAAQMFVESTLRTNYDQWRNRKQRVANGLVAVATASKASNVEANTGALESTGAAIESFENGLAEYDKVRNLASLYRQRLAALLDDSPDGNGRSGRDMRAADRTDARFADRRAVVVRQVDKVKGWRRPLLVLSVFFVELACLAWVGWAVLRAAPDSTLAGWLQTAIGLSESGRQLVLLLSAIGGSVLAVLLFWLYGRTVSRLRQFRRELEEIDTQMRIARDEISVIDAMQEAALPDALDALRNVGNDLVGSAVVSFAKGDGAVLIRPEALAEKLTQIRDGSANAAKSLRQGRQRISERAADLKRQAEEVRQRTTELEDQIRAERERWEQVEALERTIVGLEAKTTELRHQIVLRKLACELIDGACRRIYSRFHPELRRFVSKILPRLTKDRYEHLEIDDDLHVRVFCKEKNDFVGLAEISNGTHRQLMLCVRLALSQALIASSSKASQFIFFDEPFAFFDEQRMARAVDVLRRISPQITQVWLAAQKLDYPSSFDMVLDCDVANDCLVASGKKAVDGTPFSPQSNSACGDPAVLPVG
jgi:DNA repair exonuclease SbcCD ATPase subunit